MGGHAAPLHLSLAGVRPLLPHAREAVFQAVFLARVTLTLVLRLPSRPSLVHTTMTYVRRCPWPLALLTRRPPDRPRPSGYSPLLIWPYFLVPGYGQRFFLLFFSFLLSNRRTCNRDANRKNNFELKPISFFLAIDREYARLSVRHQCITTVILRTA